ncbi:MAG TPA: AtpZ/AtpI family protein [Desulfitobacteriaceae bacterium]|nr:AtpZ/AtpI family protein [Desulfitobacteriaceae bacterium]
MENESGKPGAKTQKEYSRHIEAKAARKIKAKKENRAEVWFGLGMMGIIGWSIVIPTLLGVALGRWLDKNYQGSYSWTLMMLTLGLVIGCLNAWYWIKKEEEKIEQPEDKQKNGQNNINEGRDADE